MDWRDSDLSEEEANTHSRKRSSRGTLLILFIRLPLCIFSSACDQCRKTKSKCERSVSDNIPCKSCAATGTSECRHASPSTSAFSTYISLHFFRFALVRLKTIYSANDACFQAPATNVVLLRDTFMPLSKGGIKSSRFWEQYFNVPTLASSASCRN